MEQFNSNKRLIYLSFLIFLSSCINTENRVNQLISNTHIKNIEYSKIIIENNDYGIGESSEEYTLIIDGNEKNRIKNFLSRSDFFKKNDTSSTFTSIFNNNMNTNKINTIAKQSNDKIYYQIFSPKPSPNLISIIIEKDSILYIIYEDL